MLHPTEQYLMELQTLLKKRSKRTTVIQAATVLTNAKLAGARSDRQFDQACDKTIVMPRIAVVLWTMRLAA